MDYHRRSKSILKKSDSSGHRNTDPESERLISENSSGLDQGSGSEYSPNKRLSSPPVAQRTHRTLTRNLPLSYQIQHQQQLQDDKTRTLKSPLFLLDDIMMNKEKQTCKETVLNKYSESDVPLYICPPPPPMEDNSPTEETRLLLHTTLPTIQQKQQLPGNSINLKGPNAMS